MRFLALPRRNGRGPIDPPRPCAARATARVKQSARLYVSMVNVNSICAYGICLGGGVRDAETQLCVFLEHVCKLLRKVAFFPRAAWRRQIPPPYRRENPKLSISLCKVIKNEQFLSNHEGGYLTLGPATLKTRQNRLWVDTNKQKR